MAGPLSKKIMEDALLKLDEAISAPLSLIIGGGGAMILAHEFPLSTSDIDAVPKGMELSALDTLVKKIAATEHLPADWMNPYFSSFTHTLPPDYEKRLIKVFTGKHLLAFALGKEEMLIMKCFAHRPKDVGHARALLKNGVDLDFVQTHLESLQEKGIRGIEEAIRFLDDLLE